MEIEEIYLKYKLHMFCIANNILNNYHLSEDAVQIAFIKIFENHKKIKDKKEKEIKAYISVVVANVAKTLYSINKKEQIKIPADIVWLLIVACYATRTNEKGDKIKRVR